MEKKDLTSNLSTDIEFTQDQIVEILTNYTKEHYQVIGKELVIVQVTFDFFNDSQTFNPRNCKTSLKSAKIEIKIT